MDFSYYYDFSHELTIKEWEKSYLSCDRMRWTGSLVLPQEKAGYFPYMALWPEYLTIEEINGRKVENRSRSLYIGLRCGRNAFPVLLSGGENRIEAVMKLPDDREAVLSGKFNFEMGFVPDFEEGVKTAPYQAPAPSVEPISVRKSAWKADLTGTPGAGRAATPGRFGFAKGDGLLDYAISKFGLVDKMYLCGHPKHPAPYRWGYCVLPGDEDAHIDIADIRKHGDEIRINQLAASWKSQNVLLEYSLGSPGLYVSSPSKDMRLSQLEFAGSPQYVMTSESVTDLDRFDPSSMKENFLLLFGSREYVEVPILVLLDRKPDRMEITRKGNRVSAITFRGCRRMITATPFGLEVLDPAAPSDTEFLKEALMRAKFWSRALLALPAECVDHFKIDEANRLCRITQKFTHKIFSDQWNTVPLKLAPYPPAAVLSGRGEFDPNAADLKFPTKYGDFLAVEGECSSYTIPLMPDDIRFPLEEEGGRAAELLNSGLKDYFDFQNHFADDIRPYAYIGSTLERWGFAAMLAHFMPDEYRKMLADKAGNSLDSVCDPEGTYTYLVTEHGHFGRAEEHSKKATIEYYDDPGMQRKKMKNYYHRKEPFTGVEYLICYLNVWWLRRHGNLTDREIALFPQAYIENDWGLGISFYTLYTCALASGDFSQIRKHWDVLKKMYVYLDHYHDWACLSAGYSERGTTWCEGANYGAYTAFPRLAKAVGDTQAYEYGRYLAAKELALRMAIYRSSQNYFCKCYKVPPYGISKAFREEESPCFQFQGIPQDLDRDRLRPGQLHTFITEGTFPELLRHFRQLLPDEHRDIIRRYLAQTLAPEWSKIKFFWFKKVTPTMILLELADDPAYPADKFLQAYEQTVRMDYLIGFRRDMDTFSTIQPERLYQAMILANFEARTQPLQLEHWEDMQIMKACHTKQGKVIIRYAVTGEKPILICRLKDGAKVRESFPAAEEKDGKLFFRPTEKQGMLEITF